MGRKLYVGNLPYSATEQTLRDAFSASGTVDSATVITDRDTGQSKGFGFVEMSTDAEAQAATQAMNGQTIDGRQIKVNEAKPKTSGGGGGGRSGGGGGYGGWRRRWPWRLRRWRRRSLLSADLDSRAQSGPTWKRVGPDFVSGARSTQCAERYVARRARRGARRTSLPACPARDALSRRHHLPFRQAPSGFNASACRWRS